jgi:transposase-like protein
VWIFSKEDKEGSFRRLPCAHHKRLKSTNLLERLNQEIKRWTRVAADPRVGGGNVP